MGLSLTPCTGHMRSDCSSFSNQHVFFEMDFALWDTSRESGEEINPPAPCFVTPNSVSVGKESLRKDVHFWLFLVV